MVTIEELSSFHANNLAMIISTDEKLHHMLNPVGTVGMTKTSSGEFLKSTHDWMTKTQSITYAILKDNTAIGIISIAKINKLLQTASIGYWISSNYWNQGITTHAFLLILSKAKEMKIEIVSAKIQKTNKYSIKLWKRYNTVFIDNDDYLICQLNLNNADMAFIANSSITEA